MNLTPEQLERLPPLAAEIVRQDRKLAQQLAEPAVALFETAETIRDVRNLRREAEKIWGNRKNPGEGPQHA